MAKILAMAIFLFLLGNSTTMLKQNFQNMSYSSTFNYYCIIAKITCLQLHKLISSDSCAANYLNNSNYTHFVIK